MPTLSLNRARLMVFAFCRKVSAVGKLWATKCAEIRLLSIYSDLSGPEFSFPANPQEAGLIVRARPVHILLVLCARNISQVGYSVIARVAILVVRMPARPDPIDIKPSQSVRAVKLHFDPNENIPVVPSAASNGPRLPPRSRCSRAPCEYASLWVVVKQFAQACCGKIGLSHDTVPSLIGQRPARVDSTGGLRHFTTHACSGAAEITKCLHQAARAAASVCMPANHRRFSNPFGALTPFNAL